MKIEKKEDLDLALQKNWGFVAKRVLEKLCKHPIKTLHIGRGLNFQRMDFVGDAENIYACNVAFSYGNGQRGPCLDEKKYNLTPRHTMVDVNELDLDDSRFAMYGMFYTRNLISLKKNRYGMNGASITPHSLLDAVQQVGLCPEELLVEIDIGAQSKGNAQNSARHRCS